MKIEVSNGEILDKISILYIKLEKISQLDKRSHVQLEYDLLFPFFHHFMEKYGDQIVSYYTQLVDVNTILWNIEDEIRKCEYQEDFGEKFVHFARMVYNTNDKRAEIKKQINIFTESKIVEEKDYHPYES